VNNAGITLIGPIEWIPLEKSKHIADVNLWGMIDVTKTFLPLVKKSRGRVVNLSSMLGKCKLIAFIFGTRTMSSDEYWTLLVHFSNGFGQEKNGLLLWNGGYSYKENNLAFLLCSNVNRLYHKKISHSVGNKMNKKC